MNENIPSNKVFELEDALKTAGLPEPKIFAFLGSLCITSDQIVAQGGWMNVLLNMVPDTYPTVEDLVEAIKKGKYE